MEWLNIWQGGLMDIQMNEETEQLLTEKSLQTSGVLMPSKPKVLLCGLFYPLAILRYFEKAFVGNQSLDVRTCGTYTGAQIPWMGGMTLPAKYAKSPTYPIFGSTNRFFSWNLIAGSLGDWKPDLVVTVDAGWNWIDRPKADIVVTVGTDPHVLDYSHARAISDKFFNMQKVYMQEGDIYLPYAFSQYDHYKDYSYEDKLIDACLVGMPYDNRVKFVSALRQKGVSVVFENGPIFDEYRQLNNRAVIGLNWSSMDDMVARVFEIMAMGLCPVINRVTDLKEFFTEGEHYLGFSSLEEGVEKVLWAKNNPEEARRIAENAHILMWKYSKWKLPQHSYSERVEQILVEVGL